jgi:hypothetical protein
MEYLIIETNKQGSILIIEHKRTETSAFYSKQPSKTNNIPALKVFNNNNCAGMVF